MRRTQLLYDATLLSHGLYRSSARTGIFFTVRNLLEQFRRSGCYSIVLYCAPRYLAELRMYLESERMDDLPLFSPQNGWERFRTWAICRKERSRRSGRKLSFLWHHALFKMADLACALWSHRDEDAEWRKMLDVVDVYFSPVYKIPDPVLRTCRIPCGVMLYDVIAIRHPELKPERCVGENWWLRQLLNQIDSCDRLMVFPISEETRREAMALCPHHPHDAWRVSALAADSHCFAPCFDDARRRAVCERYGLADMPFFLIVGTLEPRKNVLFAVRAFAAFRAAHPDSMLRLAVVGGNWRRFARAWQCELNEFGEEVRNYVVQTGYVEDGDLPVLYSVAQFFVMPSLCEGFGLPLLEAMSCGCPVLSSNASAMPEVVGNAGVLFDPADVADCVCGMERLAFDDALRKTCVARGLERAAQFSWERCFAEIERGLRGNADVAVD